MHYYVFHEKAGEYAKHSGILAVGGNWKDERPNYPGIIYMSRLHWIVSSIHIHSLLLITVILSRVQKSGMHI